MMIDSAFILILSSANSIAELHITERQHEEDYRNHHKDHVLHTGYPPLGKRAQQQQETNDSTQIGGGFRAILIKFGAP